MKTIRQNKVKHSIEQPHLFSALETEEQLSATTPQPTISDTSSLTPFSKSWGKEFTIAIYLTAAIIILLQIRSIFI